MIIQSKTQNQQNYFSPTHPQLSNINPIDIHDRLIRYGCNACELGRQHNYNILSKYRGSPQAKKMIIGEAPGLEEWKQGRYFVGPAGQLLDRIFASVGWDTNTDFYLSNILKCRPLPPPGSKKQNDTPLAIHRSKCKPYIEREIDYISPHTVVLLGKTAASTLLGQVKDKYMKDIVGKVYTRKRWPNTVFFIMYHPAGLLHSQRFPERYAKMRQVTWENINTLKIIVSEFE